MSDTSFTLPIPGKTTGVRIIKNTKTCKRVTNGNKSAGKGHPRFFFTFLSLFFSPWNSPNIFLIHLLSICYMKPSYTSQVT